MEKGFCLHPSSMGKNVVDIGDEINIMFRKGAFADDIWIGSIS